MTRQVVLSALIVLATAACVRRAGRNADCVWPGEAAAQPLNPQQMGCGAHLSADAEFAEELADRYALKMAGRGDIHTFIIARQECLAAMFTAVANTHAITRTEVSRYLGTNRTLTDILVNLPFVLLYAFASSVMAKHIWRRYPPSAGWFGTTLVVACAVIFGAIGVLLGEQWSIVAESIRIGAGHLGIRAGRLPWARHRSALFAGLTILFWFAAALVRRFPALWPWSTQDSTSDGLVISDYGNLRM